MTEVFCEFRLNSAHSLPELPEGHKCRRIHGHGYRVIVTISSTLAIELDPACGWILDYAEVESIWRAKVFDVLDHRNINDTLGAQSTSERLAAWIAKEMSEPLSHLNVRLRSVEVWETEAFGARWQA